MTAADRLRKAVEERCAVWKAARNKGHLARCGICQIALEAALPIVEELERDRERLRTKLRRAMHYMEAAGIVVAMKGERDGE